VFGSVQAGTPAEVVRNWEQIKKAEKGRVSLMEGIAGDLPSLLYAHKVQRKMASLGLDRWPEDLGSAPAPDLDHAEIGRRLFAIVDVARRVGVDPEAALRGTAGTYRRRFEAMEASAVEDGVDIADQSPTELVARWKATESA
jgi:uncharacterized protein YabN with tetrapyrrole methylase and pyrophosphatase domain